jgi:hypothetical protein
MRREQGARILALLRGRAPAQHDALGAALGYEMVEAAPVAPAPPAKGVARLGLSAKEAAELVAVRERAKVANERSESGGSGD